jgi:DNA-binding LytR/AlgR family response regulator
MNTTSATAVLAEDEPLLAAGLRAELARLWPALSVVADVRHGNAAVEQALALCPDVMFLDIRMPGLSGLEAAQAIVQGWDAPGAPPLMVFVTAYDQYAVQAFEQCALDYVLKPVQGERLAQTCARLQRALHARAAGPHDTPDAGDPASRSATPQDAPDALAHTLARLQQLLASPALAGRTGAVAGVPRLEVIQASVGHAIHMVPVADVLYFEAADKYVRVITAAGEYLIRTSLRELLPQLDAQRFWQIHRGTVVRADAIATAVRDESGKTHLTLHGHRDKLVASRLYAHLFKPM